MVDLIIKDEEFSSYKEELITIENMIEAELSSLVNILTDVCENVVQEGDFHQNLESFVSKLSDMQGEISYISDLEDEISSDFLEDIEAIDETIY